ncbi:MAG: hypothetical protein HZR80_04910 [Candidatus Heimdallarchaeota archaeon]
MNQTDDITAVLVEFDSIKGPVIRKKQPASNIFPENSEMESVLMWAIRASEFSVRKIEKQTAYAKAISLRDPNFTRKKRQFGIALITETTMDLGKAESILDKIISVCVKESENKPYFKMLNGLLIAIGDFQQIINGESLTTKNPNIINQKEKTSDSNEKEDKYNEQQIQQYLLMSNRLNLFNKITFLDKENNTKTIVCLAEGFSKANGVFGVPYEYTSDRFNIQVDLRYEIPEGLEQGLEILARILSTMTTGKEFNEKVLVSAEFIDRLLFEKVDIKYYLPFLQYLISMDHFTITEFKTEEYKEQYASLKETHGD